MRDFRKLDLLVRRLRTEPTDIETLKQAVIAVADEVMWLSRQVDDAKSIAQRASSMARRGFWRGF